MISGKDPRDVVKFPSDFVIGIVIEKKRFFATMHSNVKLVYPLQR